MSQYLLKLGFCLSWLVSSFTAANAAPRIDSIAPDTVFYGKGGAVTVTVSDAKPAERLRARLEQIAVSLLVTL